MNTFDLVYQNQLTPEFMACIAWLFKTDKLEWCRLVGDYYPQDWELQTAVAAIKSVPDGCWPESFADWETAPAPYDIVEIASKTFQIKTRAEALALAYFCRETERRKLGGQEELLRHPLTYREYVLPCHRDGDTLVITLPREQRLMDVQQQLVLRKQESEIYWGKTTTSDQLQTTQIDAYFQAIIPALEEVCQRALSAALQERAMQPAPTQPPAQRQRKKTPVNIPLSERKALTPDQAASVLGMKRSKLYTILTGDDFHPERTDGLRSFKDGNQRLILPADVDEYNRRRGGTSGTTEAE